MAKHGLYPIPPPFDSPDRADFVIGTSDKRHLFVRKAFLIHSSIFFDNLLSDSSPEETHHDLPMYRVPEDSRTMCAVLRLCYPIANTLWDPIKEILAVPILPTLSKYIMEDAEQKLRIIVAGSPDVLKREPLKIFAIARQHGWDDVARAAARCLLSIPLREQSVVKELRMATALDFQLLLDYFWRCSDAVSKFLETVESKNTLILHSPFPTGSPALAILTKDPAMCALCETWAPLSITSPSGGNAGMVWHYGHPWIKVMVRNAREMLKDRPGRGLLDPCLMDDAIWLAARGCITQNHASVRCLLEVFNVEVERILDAIELEIDCGE